MVRAGTYTLSDIRAAVAKQRAKLAAKATERRAAATESFAGNRGRWGKWGKRGRWRRWRRWRHQDAQFDGIWAAVVKGCTQVVAKAAADGVEASTEAGATAEAELDGIWAAVCIYGAEVVAKASTSRTESTAQPFACDIFCKLAGAELDGVPTAVFKGRAQVVAIAAERRNAAAESLAGNWGRWGRWGRRGSRRG